MNIDLKTVGLVAVGLGVVGGIIYLATQDDDTGYELPYSDIDVTALEPMNTFDTNGFMTVQVASLEAVRPIAEPVVNAEPTVDETLSETLRYFDDIFNDVVQGRTSVRAGVRLAAMEDPATGLRGLQMSSETKPGVYTQYLVDKAGNQEFQMTEYGITSTTRSTDELSTALLVMSEAMVVDTAKA